MKKYPMRLLGFLLLLALAGCDFAGRDVSPNQAMGFAPVYASAALYDSVSVQPARLTEKAGKIYAFNNYIFQVDQQKGIHIVVGGQSANPMKIAFLKIPFCTEVAVKGNFLYANNLDDLLVFNISDPSNPQLVKRMKDAFPAITRAFPDESNTYFECVDPSKGIVVGWERKMLTNPKCQR